MTEEIPDIANILADALGGVALEDQPVLLAALERLAANRYRDWAEAHSDPEISKGLLACAAREDEIATRVESLYADAQARQEKLLADNPELGELNRTLFADKPLAVQFAMQAAGERAGAGAWTAFSAASDDDQARQTLSGCSPLETANAEFLEALASRE
jgi:hypothetical protein